MGCYDSRHNKSDVGVMEDEKINERYHGSNIVNIEVNSSPMRSTVVKTLHGLIELARIVKAHSVPNKIVTLVGFALPKLNDRGVAVRVQVWYDPECMAFSVSSKPLSCSDFFPELQSAITDNCEVLRKCKESKLRSGYKNHVLSLSYDEMEYFGKNPQQCQACFGVLFEAEINGLFQETNTICVFSKTE